MNSTKVQNPRRKLQVALLAEPKTPPGVERVYVMVNVRAARRYGIYPRSFSIPDEGGARVWYVKTTEGISCTRRDAVC